MVPNSLLKEDVELIGPPVWADFNDLDRGLVPLDKPGSVWDLEDQELTLREGMRLILYDHDRSDRMDPDDLLAAGIATFESGHQRWVAKVDARSFRHESDLPAAALARFRAARGQISIQREKREESRKKLLERRNKRGRTFSTIVGCATGLGWVLVGLATVFMPNHLRYLPGDIRGDPRFWPTVGALTVVGGIVILLAMCLYHFRRGPFGNE